MKFGLFTCGYQRAALEDAFADAVRFGYDYIELWGGGPTGLPRICFLAMERRSGR